ncbi:DoxX family protein [Pseudoalteromonas sp. LC2018020214]|uniref:DoxX family protein n=1 Tax=Pseudoalteromonas sp. LC2018020214 TaxID=2799564 RepID=UPI0019061A1B|nr:DoxX family protein [Pseudoalteromonas sp. LC2018020214]QQM62847.1 DoxX family protein [Pseudoalteromonas sp. LC2018020214]
MIYWISTIAICGILTLSSVSYIFHTPTITGVRELGFPDFFRIQLAVLKLIAVIVLVIPSIPNQLKEWAYAGVALFFLTAIIAHVAHKDSHLITIINIIFLLLLATSSYYLKLES